MADDSVFNDDESETVTRFLLNTVRLQQPTDDNLKAVAMCAAMVARHPNSDDGNDYFPLATGWLRSTVGRTPCFTFLYGFYIKIVTD